MKHKVLNIVLILVFAFFIVQKHNEENEFKYLQTSFLEILKEIVENNKPQPADLIIDKLTVRKISDPIENDNYYRYYATLKLKNIGGDFKNAEVVIDGGNNNKYELIKNTEEGLSLKNGESYIVDRHEILFDGSYNVGMVDLSVQMLDRAESDESNNHFLINIFEGQAKIQSIGIDQILDDGTFEFNYDLENYALNLDDFSILVTDSLSYNEEDQKYAETFGLDKKYSYYRIKSDNKNIIGDHWKETPLTDTGKYFVKFGDDPFNEEVTHFAYLKARNPNNGNYAVSNIIKFPPQINIDRTDFVKLFIDYADIELIEDNFIIYKDVEIDSWYAPYIQTLYYLGVLDDGDFNFNPDKEINRGEALQIILEYFDVDLAGEYESSYFEDIDLNDSISPYTQALYKSGKAGIFGEKFIPEQTANKNYLKYLIYEYKGDS